MLRGSYLITFVLAGISLVAIDCAVADYTGQSAALRKVEVQVRSFRALDPILPGEAVSFAPRAKLASQEGSFDPRLADLRSKLQRLNFRTFKFVTSERKSVPITRKEVLDVGMGDTLTVRPIYVEKDRVGMYLNWQDRSGNCILNTRMHFKPGESVLTGMDHAAGDGMILAIDVKPERE